MLMHAQLFKKAQKEGIPAFIPKCFKEANIELARAGKFPDQVLELHARLSSKNGTVNNPICRVSFSKPAELNASEENCVVVDLTMFDVTSAHVEEFILFIEHILDKGVSQETEAEKEIVLTISKQLNSLKACLMAKPIELLDNDELSEMRHSFIACVNVSENRRVFLNRKLASFRQNITLELRANIYQIPFEALLVENATTQVSKNLVYTFKCGFTPKSLADSAYTQPIIVKEPYEGLNEFVLVLDDFFTDYMIP